MVSIKAPIEAAFCSAERVTFAGSMPPWATRSPYSPVAAFPGGSAYVSAIYFFPFLLEMNCRGVAILVVLNSWGKSLLFPVTS